MGGESDIAKQADSGAPPAPVRPRLDWLDAMKGIGIALVIIAHVWTRGPVRDAIYAVHMPLFFMLSGYTARHIPWRQLFPNLLRTLALPFACFTLILLGADFLIEGARHVRPIFPDWQTGIGTILFATQKTRGPFTILWFIPCLLLARLVWNALVGGERRADSWIMLPVLLLVAALAWLVQAHGGRSPLGLLAVPGALMMMWAGAWWRIKGAPSGWTGLGLIVSAGLILGFFPALDMKHGYLGWPIVSLIGAAVVTLALSLLTRRLPFVATSVLAALGRASLVIMYVHVAFIHYLAPYAPKAVLLIVALVGSWFLDWLIHRSLITRRLLLGLSKTTR